MNRQESPPPVHQMGAEQGPETAHFAEADNAVDREICRACGAILVAELAGGSNHGATRSPVPHEVDTVEPPLLPVIARVIKKRTDAGNVYLASGGAIQIDAKKLFSQKSAASRK